MYTPSNDFKTDKAESYKIKEVKKVIVENFQSLASSVIDRIQKAIHTYLSLYTYIYNKPILSEQFLLKFLFWLAQAEESEIKLPTSIRS